ncbi:protein STRICTOSIDINE SYNTHASE-LIKE 2-like isoform X2 [Prosopis cineraria]|nr:protein STRICTOSIDINE SYNTHASE-LIKE 2-like isoform X2 [Prosopis cineraria]
MKPRLYMAAATAVVVVASVWYAHNHAGPFHVGEAWPHDVVPVMEDIGAAGPESLAFSPDGQGPYAGVSDCLIIKWDQNEKRWVNFTVTSPHREGCGGISHEEHRNTEHRCGRPLGLCFSPTGDLYIADAYFGLLVVPSSGGIPTCITSQVEGTPLAFTNNLDVDQTTGVVYFTSSSSTFPRRDYVSLILSRDKSGRVMKYDPATRHVSIVLRNVSFANGVALSENGEYILVVETTKCRVLRYWLATSKAGTSEVFAELPGFPDNIKRSPRGGFWVGIFSRQENLVRWILSYPWIGKALLKLPLDVTKAYSYLAKVKSKSGFALRLSEEGEVLEMVQGRGRGRSVSEVEERDGTLWVGSVDAPFAIKYQIPAARGLY